MRISIDWRLQLFSSILNGYFADFFLRGIYYMPGNVFLSFNHSPKASRIKGWYWYATNQYWIIKQFYRQTFVVNAFRSWKRVKKEQQKYTYSIRIRPISIRINVLVIHSYYSDIRWKKGQCTVSKTRKFLKKFITSGSVFVWNNYDDIVDDIRVSTTRVV